MGVHEPDGRDTEQTRSAIEDIVVDPGDSDAYHLRANQAALEPIGPQYSLGIEASKYQPQLLDRLVDSDPIARPTSVGVFVPFEVLDRDSRVPLLHKCIVDKGGIVAVGRQDDSSRDRQYEWHEPERKSPRSCAVRVTLSPLETATSYNSAQHELSSMG